MSMAPYVLKNTRNVTIATLNPAQTTGSTFPVELAGAGYPDYGKFMNQNFYWGMENFAKTTAPSAPVEGMNWYKTDTKTFYVYDSAAWKQIPTADNALNVAFPMQAASLTLDLTAAATVTIFTSAGSGKTWYPTGFMMYPVVIAGTFDDPSTCTLNLFKTTSEDIIENVVMGNPTSTRFAHYGITGMSEVVSGSETIKIEIQDPFTGTGITATYKAVIFGNII